MTTYNVYLFEENDNVRLVFDRHNLVHNVVRLYKMMEVTVKSIDTGYKVSQAERELLSFLLGGNSKCFTIKQEGGSEEVRTKLQELVIATQLMHKLKGSLIPYTCADLQTVVPMTSNNDTIVPMTTNNDSDLSGYHKMYIKNIDNTSTGIEPFSTSDIDEFACIMDEVAAEQKVAQKVSVCILYNTFYECVLVCDVIQSLHTIVEEFPEFQMLGEYKDISSSKYEVMKDYFAKNMYNELDVVNKKLAAFESLYDITNRDPIEEEKSKILRYIGHYYNISTNIDKRIKVSTLLEEVEKDLNIKRTSNLKYRFASMLAELGLQKKRYSDGMYIYGIESKSMAKVLSNNVDIHRFMTTHQSSV